MHVNILYSTKLNECFTYKCLATFLGSADSDYWLCQYFLIGGRICQRRGKSESAYFSITTMQSDFLQLFPLSLLRNHIYCGIKRSMRYNEAMFIERPTWSSKGN